MIAVALISRLSCTSSHLASARAHERRADQMLARSRDEASSIVLVVDALPSISSALVRSALKETVAIWKAAGFIVEWRLSRASSIASDPAAVSVVLDDARGRASGQDLPLGWISFTAVGVPEGVLHLSHRNVVELIDRTAGYRNRPTSYRELLAGRALGRALAHELGHYLTASKFHSPSGLMKAHRRDEEFFSPSRSGFVLSNDERQLVAERLSSRAPHIDRGSSCGPRTR